mgnify:CR=1 FL=1
MSGKLCLKEDLRNWVARWGWGDGSPRLGLGALLFALRKVHGRRDEASGRVSPHIVIEAHVVAEAHATLWIVGFGSVQGLVQRSRLFGGA